MSMYERMNGTAVDINKKEKKTYVRHPDDRDSQLPIPFFLLRQMCEIRGQTVRTKRIVYGCFGFPFTGNRGGDSRWG